MSVDAVGDRYLNREFVDLWRSDNAMETIRALWRRRLVEFLPYEPQRAIHVLDLGAGTGALTMEILNRYPNATVITADYSEEMLRHAREQLAKYGGKVNFVQANLRKEGWANQLEGGFDAVVSSFVTHTMPNQAEALYRELYELVGAGGCFYSCDIYAVPGVRVGQLYHRINLEDIQRRIKDRTGVEKSLSEVEQMRQQRDEKYRTHISDKQEESIMHPTVLDHLHWLSEVGFSEVDCLIKYRNSALLGAFR